MKGTRFAAISGLLSFVLALLSFIVQGDSGDPGDDSAAELVKLFKDNETQIVIGALLAAIAGVFFVVFATYMRNYLRENGAGGILPSLVFAGGIIFATGIALDSTLLLTLVEAAKDKLPASTIQGLDEFYNQDFMLFAMGMVLWLAGFGISVLNRGMLPKWLGWVAVLFVVLGFTPFGFVSFIGGSILVAIASVLLYLRSGRSQDAAPAATA